MTRKLLTILMLLAAFGASAQHQLRLPRVPDSISSPEMRANMLAVAFWDSIPMLDETADSAYVEQCLSTYAYVLHIATDTAAMRHSVQEMRLKCHSCQPTRRLVFSLAEKYLYDLRSPLDNPNAYAIILQEIIDCPMISDIEKTRPEYQLETISQNQPGTIAPDIAISTADGEAMLYDMIGEKTTMAVFYDHDCDECHALLDAIDKSAYLRLLLDQGDVKIVKIDVADNDYPEYAMRAIPSIYIIGADHKVIAKDTSLKSALEAIANFLR